jgi:hypothetical protein
MKSSLLQRHFTSFRFSVKENSNNFVNSTRRDLLQQATLEKCMLRMVIVDSCFSKPHESYSLKIVRF